MAVIPELLPVTAQAENVYCNPEARSHQDRMELITFYVIKFKWGFLYIKKNMKLAENQPLLPVHNLTVQLEQKQY